MFFALMGSTNLVVFFFFLVGFVCTAAAKVLLIGSYFTLGFDGIEAIFAPAIEDYREHGFLYLAEPLDACTALTDKAEQHSNAGSPFALIVRGGCSFEEKVRRAQEAGFKAAIVYDNEDGGVLVAMAGNSTGIRIHAIFISKASGETLKTYTGSTNVELWLIPNSENPAWSIMVISIFSILAMSAVLGICVLVRSHCIRPRAYRVCEFHGMSSRLVKAMPSLIVTSVSEDHSTSRTCAICLEDYSIGEKLRILPCFHKFHAICVDSWLTSWRAFCPVCKHDARTGLTNPLPSESTPLLSSSAVPAASSVLSSLRSSSSSSSAIQIFQATSQSPSVSPNYSLATTPNVQPSLRSYHHSPSLSVSQSSVDPRNASQRSLASHLSSPDSMVHPSLSSLNSRYIYPHTLSPSNASASFVGLPSHQQHPLHHTQSAASFSPFASANSLPDV